MENFKVTEMELFFGLPLTGNSSEYLLKKISEHKNIMWNGDLHVLHSYGGRTSWKLDKNNFIVPQVKGKIFAIHLPKKLKDNLSFYNILFRSVYGSLYLIYKDKILIDKTEFYYKLLNKYQYLTLNDPLLMYVFLVKGKIYPSSLSSWGFPLEDNEIKIFISKYNTLTKSYMKEGTR